MKINLTELANQVSERYRDVKCSFGDIRVYHVPVPFVWTLKPDWTPPPVPKNELELVTGQIQIKPVRKDSSEYKEWEKENNRWESEMEDIQTAARYVMALRDVEYPSDLSVPPPILKDYLNGHYPTNEILRKKTWLNATVLARVSDLTAIQEAIAELGVGETVKSADVDNVKKSSESDLGDKNSTELELREAEKIR